MKELYSQGPNSFKKEKGDEKKQNHESGSSDALIAEIEKGMEDVMRNSAELEKKIRKDVENDLETLGIDISQIDPKKIEQLISSRMALEIENQRFSTLDTDEIKNEELETADLKQRLSKLIAEKSKKGEVVYLDDLFPMNKQEEIALKKVILPSFIRWTKTREVSGRDANIIDFIKEENISKLELRILIDEIEKYESKETPVVLSKDGMLKKSALAEELRNQAHKILSKVGDFEHSVYDLKNAKWDKEFQEWFGRFMDRASELLYVSFNGMLSMTWTLVKYWDGQGKIDKEKMLARRGKMGELEHVLMLRGISEKIENLVGLIDSSDNAKEVRYYNNELKGYLKFLVEWNNEYVRLHKVGKNVPHRRVDIIEASDQIQKITGEVDKLVIGEIYE